MDTPGQDGQQRDGQERAQEEAFLEARHEGRLVASADVSGSTEPHGTAQVALHRHHPDAPAEVRGDLVDQVMDTRVVSSSDAVHVVLPLGDSASITRLQERTEDFTARPAGTSAVVDAAVPPPADAQER
ncbi:hypothetical protein [Microlunatus flavus]|uniref:Uncharacterized protein n=1 Tax=Microlunatus flavus TaxID=1036181 RepID=A0A1H9I464_9ACTN|nr:hypothetical protein [Microlunatus flavus]SEQ69353.1 hypothetical protein SAMN05421756_10574 [Microlunatus flavus]